MNSFEAFAKFVSEAIVGRLFKRRPSQIGNGQLRARLRLAVKLRANQKLPKQNRPPSRQVRRALERQFLKRERQAAARAALEAKVKRRGRAASV